MSAQHRFLELIDVYWHLAYIEGAERRTRDTPGGDAARVLSELQALFAVQAIEPSPAPVQPETANLVEKHRIDSLGAKPKNPLASVPSHVVIESVVKAIYAQWADKPGLKPWAEGGNSTRQDEARVVACEALSASLQPQAEPLGWVTHDETPMLFPTRAEALEYCNDGEFPIPLYAGAAIDAAMKGTP